MSETEPAVLSDNENTVKFAHFLGIYYALMKSLQGVEWVGNTINGLVAQVRNGDDDALFAAVRLDRCVTSAPSIAGRLARAELTGEQEFFRKLSNAIQRPYVEKAVDYGELRYVLMALQEAGNLEQLSEEARYELLCLDLALYPTEGDDPAGSLNRFIRRWQKESRT